ncbi:CO/xanthine dehydrogenase Mo-binding subunit [Bradyrhizobium sp. LM2.9]
MGPSRREFVKWLSAGGISVSLSHLASAAGAPFAAQETLPGRGKFNPATTGAGRVDGVAKVTGAKLYASDFRANDLPGWPQATSHAILVRANDATHVYTGMDLGRLGGALKPSVVVTAADLDWIGTQVPEFYAGDLFCPIGKTPLYLGQPVALLIFEKFDAFDQARLALRDGTFVQFGEETGPVVVPDYGAFRFTRVAGPSPDKPDVYSPLQAGWVSPKKVQSAALPVWSPLAKEMPADYAKAAKYGEQIRAELAADDASMLVLDREFETQSVDPMFLEPECGLAWYNGKGGDLELLLGVQSPYEAAESIAHLLGKAHAPYKPAHINAQFAHVGGGFGGRDHTPFILYVALAAVCFPGKPVRLAHDRYQQFQAGIKRHAIKMRSRIGIDRATGKIKAFAADHVLDGGGLAHFSASVAVVAATGAIGIYDIPKVDVRTVAVHSRGVSAGSMRGYGILQAMTALEVLIDEAAVRAQARSDRIPAAQCAAPERPDHDGQSLHRLGSHARNPRQAREAPDLAAAGTVQTDIVGSAGRHRRRLRDERLWLRRGRLARARGACPRRQDRHLLRSCRDGQRHRDGAGQPGRQPSRRHRRRGLGRPRRQL